MHEYKCFECDSILHIIKENLETDVYRIPICSNCLKNTKECTASYSEGYDTGFKDGCGECACSVF